MSLSVTRPCLEALEDRAVPAAVGPMPSDPSDASPAQAASAQPGPDQQQAATPPAFNPAFPGTTSPTSPNQTTSSPGVTGSTQPTPLVQPSNGAVLSTPAQNAGQALLLVPNQQITFSNVREPAAGTSPNPADVERLFRSNVEQGLRDAVGGSPVRRMMEAQPTFSDNDAALDQEALLPPR